jgi:hypothetical protein
MRRCATPCCTIVLAERLRKVDEEVFGGHRKSLCQLHNILQSDVPFASLYPPDIVTMKSGAFGKLFLRVAPFVAKSAQRHAQLRLNGTSGHIPILEA